MILADTSIWIEMFRKGAYKDELASLIANDQLCMHPFVVAELACGNLPERAKTLGDLDHLTALPAVPVKDVRAMIESRGLAGKGIGFVDVQLIASCLLTAGARLWTLDARLDRVADALGIRAEIAKR